MNAKLLTILVAAALALPVAYAAHGDDGFGDWGENGQKFGDCPSGWSCDQEPSGEPFPPDAVTGHTVYASFIMERNRDDDDFVNNTLGLPTDFAAIAGFFSFEDNRERRDEVARAVQRECVVWFNGMNLDQRPEDDNFGPDNSFPSDEDEDPPSDQSYQDYDFDRDVHNCEPEFDSDLIIEPNVTAGHGDFAVAVEKGDCNPGGPTAGDFRFRGHLDFVDPNGIYHEVQEYDYVCQTSVTVGAFGASATVPPQEFSPNRIAASTVESFFPWTFSDEHNEEGCTIHGTPGPAEAGGNTDLGNGDPGHFDLGHKCNGSVQDLFKERLWITPIHAEVMDPTIQRVYNFALQIDTCAGINIYEIDGKEAMGEENDFENSEQLPGGPGSTALQLYHEVAYHTYYSTGLDEFTNTGWPLFDVCTDGSSFSFNDTPRGRQVHSGPPAGPDDNEVVMRGNSYNFDEGSDTFGKHRTNCRVQDMDWPMNTYPPGPPAMGEDCYPEDHKTAEVDLYVYDFDPTGLWDVNTNGGTGPDVYPDDWISTGPDGEPDA